MSSFSSMTTMLQTSNIVWQTVCLTDELKINLEYDIHRGLLNIFVKNTSDNKELPCHINVLSEECMKNNLQTSIEIPSEQTEIVFDDNEPKIFYEISTSYVYDLIDENETTEQTMIISSSASSSCFDEQTMDNDDGYSTHSLDDIEQQLSLAIPSPKSIVPSFLSQHHYYCYSEQYVSPIRRLIEQLTWLSPFKKTMQDMMMSHIFD